MVAKRSVPYLVLCIAMALVAIIILEGQKPLGDTDDRASDRTAIRAHIEKIFTAFAQRDIPTIRATHAQDWIGFTMGARSIIHGIDGYMKGSSAGNERAFKDSNSLILVEYKITEIDYQFYGDVALVPYVAEVRAGMKTRLPMKFRSLDVYAKVNGEWIQVGSNIYLHPETIEAFRQNPLPPALQDKKGLLSAREAVWRAFFTNDRMQLEQLVPEETIIFTGNKQQPFGRQKDVFDAAKQSSDFSKLIRIEFPQTEIQAYGDVAILYTTYLYELENKSGERKTFTGRATETFVRRQGQWVNPGWLLDADKQN